MCSGLICTKWGLAEGSDLLSAQVLQRPCPRGGVRAQLALEGFKLSYDSTRGLPANELEDFKTVNTLLAFSADQEELRAAAFKKFSLLTNPTPACHCLSMLWCLSAYMPFSRSPSSNFLFFL